MQPGPSDRPISLRWKVSRSYVLCSVFLVWNTHGCLQFNQESEWFSLGLICQGPYSLWTDKSSIWTDKPTQFFWLHSFHWKKMTHINTTCFIECLEDWNCITHKAQELLTQKMSVNGSHLSVNNHHVCTFLCVYVCICVYVYCVCA